MSQTEAAELPPQYSEYPTNTNLPSQFPIGGQNTSPLVNVAELQAHLRLLGAIHKLKEDVQSQQDGIAATNKEITWVVFVNKAVYRFFAWTAAIWVRESSVVSEWDIPPLDVIMVWHTYLLNPRAFFEDSRRMSTEYCTNLIEIEEMPLALISSLIDSETLDPLPPSNERQDTFEQTAKLPYHISLVTDYSEALTLTCPFCAHPNQSVLWLNDGEKGYAQTQFEHSCEKCGSNFSKSNIGIRRFCEEITRRRTGERIFFPEILLNPLTGLLDEKTATATITKIFKYLDAVYQVLQPMPPGENIHAEATRLAEGLNYDHLQLSDTLHRAVNPYSAPNRSRPTPRQVFHKEKHATSGLTIDCVGI
ncbi:hypothetical protein FRC17_004914 [Serendipita sp. 399]|nr:hypothetical protein FRC17_004914 [Serendipita sp. 399]